MSNFYDEVAVRLGGYDLTIEEPKHISTYQDRSPDEIFREKLLGILRPEHVALDVGCGDGTFSFTLSDKLSKLIGLDSSRELLRIANQKKVAFGVDNFDFVFGDASRSPFTDDSFDVIFNRRGPSFYGEYLRLLKPGGHYLEIGIGEKDALELKKTFGRGQNFGEWDQPRLIDDTTEFSELGGNVIFAQNYFYSETYLSNHNFEQFLDRVPIFEDFNVAADKQFLNDYYSTHSNGTTVHLDRHRVVYVIQN